MSGSWIGHEWMMSGSCNPKLCGGRKDRENYLQKQLPSILPIFVSTCHFSHQEVKSVSPPYHIDLRWPTKCSGSDMVSVLELKGPDSFCFTSPGALSYHIKKPCWRDWPHQPLVALDTLAEELHIEWSHPHPPAPVKLAQPTFHGAEMSHPCQSLCQLQHHEPINKCWLLF